MHWIFQVLWVCLFPFVVIIFAKALVEFINFKELKGYVGAAFDGHSKRFASMHLHDYLRCYTLNSVVLRNIIRERGVQEIPGYNKMAMDIEFKCKSTFESY